MQYIMPEDRFCEIKGTWIRIREQGDVGAPPFILLHGFTLSLESFDSWAEELAKTHRVIRYDLLGHGLSGPDPQKRYAPNARAVFLLDVMDALKIGSASVAGNSLGGLIAWKAAVMAPERVDRLVLVAPAAYSINAVKDAPAPISMPLRYFLTYVPDAGIEATMHSIYADTARATPGRGKLLAYMMKHKGNGQAFIDHLEAFALPEPSAQLACIKAPTLVIWGAQDRLIPVAQAHWLARDIPDARLHIFKALGHVPQEEDPIATFSALQSFIKGD